MKKLILSLGILALSLTPMFAQDHAGHSHGEATEAKESSTLKPEHMAFKSEIHDFGVLEEGPEATHEFVFKNTGKEPIVIQQVKASCGCTTPSWSKEPILPGKTGTISAAYATKGRPHPFSKTITVVSNAGTKVLTIKGNVEAAPTSSVPANSSMIKTQ